MRLSSVIDGIVGTDQVGYIKGRRVSTLLRLIDDITDQHNILHKPGLLVTIDYVHAFDCISTDFMLKAFEQFGFGTDFVKWVDVLMKDTKSCVSYCGWLSDFFAVDSGIRQGCPFSPLAFVLAVELLAIKIRDCKDIKGLRHWDALNDAALEAMIKMSLYADDITLFLENEQDMFYALSIIEDFSLISGLKINKNKSEAMWLGSKKHCKQSFFNFVWKKKI